MSINDILIWEARQQIVAVAQSMLVGERLYIEGVRMISGMLDRGRLDRFSEPFSTFVAIDSETDTVPTGEFREQWNPEARNKLEAEWADAENYAKMMGEPACRSAIAWIADHPTWDS